LSNVIPPVPSERWLLRQLESWPLLTATDQLELLAKLEYYLKARVEASLSASTKPPATPASTPMSWLTDALNSEHSGRAVISLNRSGTLVLEFSPDAPTATSAPTSGAPTATMDTAHTKSTSDSSEPLSSLERQLVSTLGVLIRRVVKDALSVERSTAPFPPQETLSMSDYRAEQYRVQAQYQGVPPSTEAPLWPKRKGTPAPDNDE
jgi:hypothetical protein